MLQMIVENPLSPSVNDIIPYGLQSFQQGQLLATDSCHLKNITTIVSMQAGF
jgi:hypothetical protein